MTNDKEKAIRNFRKLNSFFENNLPVFFKLDEGYDKGNWRKGKILDLNFEKLTIIIEDKIVGNKPYLLEDIKEDSIAQKNKEEGNEPKNS